MIFSASKRLHMHDLGLQCWATEVTGCHPKTLELLCLADILCQKTHYQKLGKFPRPHRQVKGQRSSMGWNIFKSSNRRPVIGCDSRVEKKQEWQRLSSIPAAHSILMCAQFWHSNLHTTVYKPLNYWFLSLTSDGQEIAD